MKLTTLDTPLGTMVAIADQQSLYLLEFDDNPRLEHKLKLLREKTSTILPGVTAPIESIKTELQKYFSGKLKIFTTPLFLMGSPFQQKVWRALQMIAYGENCSYANVANTIHQGTACRAVANANGANQLAIVIPCHRVIRSNGNLGGYAGGIARKEWLIKHEKNNSLLTV